MSTSNFEATAAFNWNDYRTIGAELKAAPYIKDETSEALPQSMPGSQTLPGTLKLDSLDAKATEFVWQFKDSLRYVQSRGTWLVWDQHVWKWDTTGKAQELVKMFGRDFARASDFQSKEQIENDRKWYRILTSPKGINDILTLAKTDPIMAASPEQFDAGTLELNTPAGIVNLRTGKLTPPTSTKLVKRSTSAAPDFSCATPFYEHLLQDAFVGSPDLSSYFEAMMGVTLLKGQQEQVFMYMFGKAGSGKGTLMNIAKDILGVGESGYAAYVDSAMFVSSRQSQHPTELMQFLGARMVISSEITQGQKMDTGKLKRLTGGDSITGRYMGKDFVTFDPTHTLWLMANDRLQVPHDDQGVWRRLRVLPFDFAKKESEQVSGLYEKIMAEEAPGILARWVEAAQAYLESGMLTPDSVLAAREEYKQEQDTVAEWIESKADDTDPTFFTRGDALRDSYNNWCRSERKTPLSTGKFGAALAEKGFTATKKRIPVAPGMSQTTQHRGYFGLQLVDSARIFS
ncbi:phage/plasmid primase, P4 family [Arthrobacter sp. BF1]|uniref:DNA primase family protein n=1 Tax=Arthrobacter sp. BF1 TaxID=2821145 RepID=UPI001C4E4676|nr:phage/plasmid primase, P4 family [Arthrobacter sp. BF1]